MNHFTTHFDVWTVLRMRTGKKIYAKRICLVDIWCWLCLIRGLHISVGVFTVWVMVQFGGYHSSIICHFIFYVQWNPFKLDSLYTGLTVYWNPPIPESPYTGIPLYWNPPILDMAYGSKSTYFYTCINNLFRPESPLNRVFCLVLKGSGFNCTLYCPVSRVDVLYKIINPRNDNTGIGYVYSRNKTNNG